MNVLNSHRLSETSGWNDSEGDEDWKVDWYIKRRNNDGIWEGWITKSP